MKAYEMKGRKIKFQWKGKDEVLNCFVNDFRVEEEKAIFNFTTVTGKTFDAKDGEFNWQDNEEEIERLARKRYTHLLETEKLYGGLDAETLARMNQAMGFDILGTSRNKFEEVKAQLIAYRIEKSKVHRQYYNDKDLHVFYDIKHGNNVNNFMTLEEIEQMKKRWEKPDILRGKTELHHLQAFDKDFNLVLDEWNM